MTDWYGIKVTVGRFTTTAEVRPWTPRLRWNWKLSLMAPRQWGAGLWITKDWT